MSVYKVPFSNIGGCIYLVSFWGYKKYIPCLMHSVVCCVVLCCGVVWCVVLSCIGISLSCLVFILYIVRSYAIFSDIINQKPGTHQPPLDCAYVCMSMITYLFLHSSIYISMFTLLVLSGSLNIFRGFTEPKPCTLTLNPKPLNPKPIPYTLYPKP